MTKNVKTNYTAEEIALQMAVAVPVGAVCHGIFGSLGKFSLSFFNPSLASCAGTFSTFAGVGAIALPLVIIPKLLKAKFFDNSSMLEDYPVLKNQLSKISDVFISIGSVATAALILGIPPFGATVISIMVIDVAVTALKALYTLASACLNDDCANDVQDELHYI